MEQILKIEGMSCGHCVDHVESALKGVEGVTKVEVSLEDKQALVTTDPDVKVETLKEAVTNAGYTCE